MIQMTDTVDGTVVRNKIVVDRGSNGYNFHEPTAVLQVTLMHQSANRLRPRSTEDFEAS